VNHQPKNKPNIFKHNGISYLIPFVLITSLFLIWGVSHALLDVLNKHFQNVLHVSKMESGYIQAAMYGGYFIAALPAGILMQKIGFRKSIMVGLFVVASGAFLFFPATELQEFWSFLIPLFVIACGLACLETAANPYTTVLGPPESAERRINLAQSFNAVGWIFGTMLGSAVILSSTGSGRNQFDAMAIPYIFLGGTVLIVGLFFLYVPLPENEENPIISAKPDEKNNIPLFKRKFFVYAVIAQFFYVAAQTGINSFFINFSVEAVPNLSDENAGYLLAIGGMCMFFLGRLSGSFLMGRFNPVKILTLYAIINVLNMIIVVANLGWISVIALFITYFFMSVMFPTIFSLGIKGLGPKTKKASSFIVMAIVGGAVCPPLMGYIADQSSMNLGFIVPLVCFGFVVAFGVVRLKGDSSKTVLQ